MGEPLSGSEWGAWDQHVSSDNPGRQLGYGRAQWRVGFLSPGQVVAVDPDLGENGTLVYSIQPPNKFYSLNSSTGKIRTTHVMLDRENPDPQEAELMRKIIVSVTDCTCPTPLTPGLGPLTPPRWFALGGLGLPRTLCLDD